MASCGIINTGSQPGYPRTKQPWMRQRQPTEWFNLRSTLACQPVRAQNRVKAPIEQLLSRVFADKSRVRRWFKLFSPPHSYSDT